ncbi:MAG: Lcl C-terminal domain-containing protein [Planctomycetota bacterium]|jgi:hypothetical protein
MRKSITSAALAAILLCFTTLSVTPAQAVEPAAKCESGKLKVSSKYSACRLKADAKAALKGGEADYSKCESKFSGKWASTEAKGGGACPTNDDEIAMDARITTDAAEIATLLAGGTVSLCGNGVIDVGEDCDFGDLNGETCATQGLFGDGLACTPGTCVFDTSGCSATRYEDTGLGTVIDHQTGLEWQKTDDAGGPTDKDNLYSWSISGTDPDGTTFTEFLVDLNAPDGPGSSSKFGPTDTGCYAGRCDWRMPVIEELRTIVDCSFGNPCIDQSVFGSTNASSNYYSSSTNLSGPFNAWTAFFGDGAIPHSSKMNGNEVRAVRGGF